MKVTLRIFLINLLFFWNTSYTQNEAIETSGDVLLVALPVAAISSTLILGDKDGSWQFLQGFALNGITTYSLKFLVKKERPDLSNNHSFPSGHTSATFQSAAFIQKRYGWKFGIPAYTLASYAGFTRLNANKHEFVDVLAGAVIGVGSAYIFTTPYQNEHMELTFSKSDDSYLFGFKYQF